LIINTVSVSNNLTMKKQNQYQINNQCNLETSTN